MTTSRLLILGLDGATWTVLDPMRRLGLMPNLDALLARAAYGTLRSVVPPVTTAAWTSMMTGCGPARHGIFDHRYFDVTSGQMKVNHSASPPSADVSGMRFLQAGRSVVSLNLPATYPPLDVRGIVVSGMDAPHLDAAVSKAPEFAARRPTEAPGYSLRYFWKQAPRTLEELQSNAKGTIESFLGRAQGGILADRIVADWSVMMVQFQNLDPFQHRAWNLLNVDATGIDRPEWNASARSVLKGLDDAIGVLLELAEKRGAMVLAVSDHGFGPCLGRIHVNRILTEAGVAHLPGLRGRLRRRLKQARENLRLRLLKQNDPEARSSSFDLSVVAQFPFDWKRTLAFAPHQDTAAMVYLNTTDRRADAPLKTPRQIDEARTAAAEALRNARHPETDMPLFPTVIATGDAYGVDPAREGYPELIGLPEENYWVRTKLSPGTVWIEPDLNLPGTHRPEGIVAIAGTGILPGRTLDADLRDIAPTVYSLFDLAIPTFVEGKPLDVVSGGRHWRQDEQANPVNGPHEVPAFDYTPEDEAIIQQRLADLGYE